MTIKSPSEYTSLSVFLGSFFSDATTDSSDVSDLDNDIFIHRICFVFHPIRDCGLNLMQHDWILGVFLQTL